MIRSFLFSSTATSLGFGYRGRISIGDTYLRACIILIPEGYGNSTEQHIACMRPEIGSTDWQLVKRTTELGFALLSAVFTEARTSLASHSIGFFLSNQPARAHAN